MLFINELSSNRKRAKGRDFYDIVFLSSLAKPNFEYIKIKLGAKDVESLRKKLLDRIKALDFKELGRDVKPFLFNADDVRKVELFPEFLAQILG